MDIYGLLTKEVKFYVKTIKNISFFIIVALVYICIPSIVFAANATPGKPTNIKIEYNTSLNTSLNTAQVTWNAPVVDGSHDAAVSYTVTIDKGASVENNSTSNLSDNLINLSKSIKYTLTITPINSGGSGTAAIITLNSPYSSVQTIANGGLIDSTPLTAGDVKSIPGQMMHGAYQNNTNTCANCHSTHSGKTEDLLSKESTYETCVSCHDGSLGFYNVFEANVENDKGPGTFAGTIDGNMSMHISNGSFMNSAAPGADLNMKDISGSNLLTQNNKDTFGKEFDCASCHNPHGSSMPFLLKTDPMGYSKIARKEIIGADTNDKSGVYYGGLIIDKIPVIQLVDYPNDPENHPDPQPIKIGSQFTLDAAISNNLSAPADLNDNSPLNNYSVVKFQLSVAGSSNFFNGLKADDWVVQVYKYDKDLSKWVIAPFTSSGEGLDLWTDSSTKLSNWKSTPDDDGFESVVQGYVINGDGAWVKVLDGTIASSITYVSNIATTFNFYNFSQNDTVVASGNIFEGTQLYKTDYTSLLNQFNNLGTDPNTINDQKSRFNQFNEWCSTCHMGFNISNAQKNNLGSAKVYTHHTSSGSEGTPCVECHYSHGTDVTWMKGTDGLNFNGIKNAMTVSGKDFITADGVTIKYDSDSTVLDQNILNYLKDTNQSSALKRYSNSTSCFRCHGTTNP